MKINPYYGPRALIPVTFAVQKITSKFSGLKPQLFYDNLETWAGVGYLSFFLFCIIMKSTEVTQGYSDGEWVDMDRPIQFYSHG